MSYDCNLTTTRCMGRALSTQMFSSIFDLTEVQTSSLIFRRMHNCRNYKLLPSADHSCWKLLRNLIQEYEKKKKNKNLWNLDKIRKIQGRSSYVNFFQTNWYSTIKGKIFQAWILREVISDTLFLKKGKTRLTFSAFWENLGTEWFKLNQNRLPIENISHQTMFLAVTVSLLVLLYIYMNNRCHFYD